MDTIENTINRALPRDVQRQANQYVRPVITALEQREDEMKQALTRYATGKGLSQREVDAALVEIGLTGGQGGVGAGAGELQAIQRTLEDLTTRLDNLAKGR